MRKLCVVAITVILLALGINAQADVFNLGTGFTNLETVAVGDAGNIAYKGKYGGVEYGYNIGKYEVTAKQYTEFLNAVSKTDTYGLYNDSMWWDAAGCKIARTGSSGSYVYSVASDMANRPVNYVSYWDSLRFANWLHNGQKTDATTTEYGAYTLTTTGIADNTVVRNAGWTWAVASMDEWVKAAYYKGGNTNAGYYLYPTSNDAAPGRDLSDISGNNANYRITSSETYPIDSGKYTTVVGEFQNSDSPYGTFDQGGNVLEWTEGVFVEKNRLLRGGWMNSYDSLNISGSNYGLPTSESYIAGFRVVRSQAVPEPTTLLGFGLPMLMIGLAKLRALRSSLIY